MEQLVEIIKAKYEAAMMHAPTSIDVNALDVPGLKKTKKRHWRRLLDACGHLPTGSAKRELILVLRDCWYNLTYDIIKWAAIYAVTLVVLGLCTVKF
jgi:hypothetical protein